METSLQKIETTKTALAEAYKNIALLKLDFEKAIKEYKKEVKSLSRSINQRVLRKANWKERILDVFKNNESRVFTAVTMANMLSEDRKCVPTISAIIHNLIKNGKVEKVDKGIFRAVKAE